jgi:hypothetical protein
MGAARRLCVRAVVLAGMLSALLGLAMPGCSFPDYGMARAHAGSAGAATGGVLGDAGDPTSDAGEGGSETAGAAGATGAAGAAGGDTPPPLKPCAAGACVPAPPPGWQGPIAYWEAMASAGGTPPSCPVGYNGGEQTDLHRDLNAPDGECTCTCTATGQVCGVNTVLHIFSDQACSTGAECGSATAKTCDAVSGGCTGSQGTVRGVPAAPTGGSCMHAVKPIPPPTWDLNARICPTTNAGSCEDPSQVCAPTPRQPYATGRCVVSVIPETFPLPPCPVEYPKAIPPLYDSYADGRGCTECSCGNVSGGSCSGKVTLSSGIDCSSGFEYQLDGTCSKPFNLGPGDVKPAHVGGTYLLVPGTCAVPTQPMATGKAVPNGSVTVVCCK